MKHIGRQGTPFSAARAYSMSNLECPLEGKYFGLCFEQLSAEAEFVCYRGITNTFKVKRFAFSLTCFSLVRMCEDHSNASNYKFVSLSFYYRFMRGGLTLKIPEEV